MHEPARAYVARTLLTLLEPRRVLEFGSRNVNGEVRDLLPAAARYCGIDLRSGPGVSVVADATTFGRSASCDLILCCELLEHTPDGAAICANAARVLRRGGYLIATCATDPRAPHSGIDGGPLQVGEHYANVAPRELLAWVADAGLAVRQYEVHEDRGDLYLVAVKR